MKTCDLRDYSGLVYMSYNQSKTEKNDAFYRKSGRSSSFNQQRGPSGGHGRGSGGPTPASSLNSNRRSVRVY